jgi:hypothetical protein
MFRRRLSMIAFSAGSQELPIQKQLATDRAIHRIRHRARRDIVMTYGHQKVTANIAASSLLGGPAWPNSAILPRSISGASSHCWMILSLLATSIA